MHQLTSLLHFIDTEHHGISVAKAIEKKIIQVLYELKIRLAFVVTDAAGQYLRARRILSLRWTCLVFLNCFAHQVNLIVGDLMRTDFKDLIKDASRLVQFFNKSVQKWLLRLSKMQIKMYGYTLAILNIALTRWNRYLHSILIIVTYNYSVYSVQSLFAGLLRTESAIRAVRAMFNSSMAQDIKDLIDSTFFIKIKRAEVLIRPTVVASCIMQGRSSLAHVLHVYGLVYTSFIAGGASKGMLVLKNDMRCVAIVLTHLTASIAKLEQRWGKEEHPLILLVHALHPKFWFRGISGVCRGDLIPFAQMYYRRFFQDQAGANRLPLEFSVIFNELEEPFTAAARKPFEEVAPEQYWLYVQLRGHVPAVSRLALHIVPPDAHATSCEQLFSEYGLIVTRLRNKLSIEKARQIALVRGEVRRQAMLEEERYAADPVAQKKRVRSLTVDCYDAIIYSNFIL